MGKDKLKRFKENEKFTHVFQPGFYEVHLKDYKLKGQWAEKYFQNNNPIVLELGCGKGEYTTGLAQQNPDKNFIGIDIKGARLWRGAKTVQEKDLKNVAFIRSSVNFAESFFAENEISEIWLTFSDPQPKRFRKRLSSTLFLNRYANFLKKEGIMHLKTDSQLLFEYTNALVEKNNFTVNYISRDVYSDRNIPSMVSEIQTFYEKQFLKEGKKINYLQFRLNQMSPFIEPKEFIETEAIHYIQPNC